MAKRSTKIWFLACITFLCFQYPDKLRRLQGLRSWDWGWLLWPLWLSCFLFTSPNASGRSWKVGPFELKDLKSKECWISRKELEKSSPMRVIYNRTRTIHTWNFHNHWIVVFLLVLFFFSFWHICQWYCNKAFLSGRGGSKGCYVAM